MRRGFQTIVVLAALAAGAPARADRVLESIDASPTGVVVHFACPMRYVAHFPARSGSEVRIDLQPMPGCSLTGAGRELLPAGDGTRSAVTDAEFDLQNGVRPTLTLHFARALEFELRPQPGFEAIEVRFQRRAATVAVEPSQPPPDASRRAVRPLPANDVIEREFESARLAMLKKDYDAAVRTYTKLLEYPEHAWRARAQEYLGLARERKRQFAQARAEYEEYLRRYPENEGAPRVSQRLAALATLERRRGAGGGFPGDPDASPWSWTAGLSQLYRSDRLKVEDASGTQTLPDNSAVVTDVDFSLRRRGESLDFASRIAGGYLYDGNTPATVGGTGTSTTPTRLSAAWVDFSDRTQGWSTRLGRQSRTTGGIYGIFDGVYAGWRVRPGLRLNAMAGLPRDNSRAEFGADRKFLALSADFLGLMQGFDLTTYAVEQRIGSLEDRRAIGTEVRWYRPGRTAIALIDYDVSFQALNAVVLQGTWTLPGRWLLNGTLDHRRSPFVSTRNALIGQPVTQFSDLLATFTPDELRQLADDRTATANLWSLGVTRPWGERLQWSVDVSSVTYQDQPASGGVAAIAAQGAEMQYTTQLLGSGWLRDGDMHVLGLRHSTNDLSSGDGIFWSARFPVYGGLRIGPRLRYDRRTLTSDSSRFAVVSGSLTGDWRFRRGSLEFEGGTDRGTQDAQPVNQTTRRLWFSLGYRIFF